MPNQPYVFISYSSKETSAAEQVRSVLLKNSIACWMAPASIEGGSDYTKAIPSAISNCGAVVLVCSRNAQSSYWVKSEIIDAISKGKPIVPFIIDKAEMNSEFNFMLSPAHRILAYENKSKAYEKLVNSLKSLLYQPQTQTQQHDPYHDPNQPQQPPERQKPQPVSTTVPKQEGQLVAVKRESHPAAMIAAWFIFILSAAASIIISETQSGYGVPEKQTMSGSVFFETVFMLIVTLICIFLAKKHISAPTFEIIKARRNIVMIYGIQTAVSFIFLIGFITNIFSSFVFCLDFALFFAIACAVLSIAYTVLFRRNRFDSDTASRNHLITTVATWVIHLVGFMFFLTVGFTDSSRKGLQSFFGPFALATPVLLLVTLLCLKSVRKHNSASDAIIMQKRKILVIMTGIPICSAVVILIVYLLYPFDLSVDAAVTITLTLIVLCILLCVLLIMYTVRFRKTKYVLQQQ
ncbi:MAG: toll/interleukin-1 receptor domain-containing protein [Ruminococcus sp.]|nr:toll/interleukin-1 receptor domain-containing protein [Ruminococcus sp.]MBQ6153746.1 toll/interleukin-1 receptor domain-containing protein [Ruminococcus sp.]